MLSKDQYMNINKKQIRVMVPHLWEGAHVSSLTAMPGFFIMKKANLIGQKFGRLTVIDEDDKKNGIVHWKCLCDCGNEVSVRTCHLRSGAIQSCGCLQRERTSKANSKHRMSGTPEHLAWKSIKARCYNKNNSHYKYYGGRDIKVCERWINNFDNFFKDMGPRPGPRYSIDRIDNDGDYTPNNCRWADTYTQANNKSDSRFITYNGETKTITQWAREIGIGIQTLYGRIDKLRWPIEKALTQPVKR